MRGKHDEDREGSRIRRRKNIREKIEHIIKRGGRDDFESERG